MPMYGSGVSRQLDAELPKLRSESTYRPPGVGAPAIKGRQFGSNLTPDNREQPARGPAIIGGGATVETSDIQALLHSLDWAYGEAQARS